MVADPICTKSFTAFHQYYKILGRVWETLWTYWLDGMFKKRLSSSLGECLLILINKWLNYFVWLLYVNPLSLPWYLYRTQNALYWSDKNHWTPQLLVPYLKESFMLYFKAIPEKHTWLMTRISTAKAAVIFLTQSPILCMSHWVQWTAIFLHRIY